MASRVDPSKAKEAKAEYEQGSKACVAVKLMACRTAIVLTMQYQSCCAFMQYLDVCI